MLDQTSLSINLTSPSINHTAIARAFGSMPRGVRG
jgi:hypothetical protein